MESIPTITLKNGLVVANFSSNHSKFNPTSNVAFKFDDGSELENCSIERMKALSLENDDGRIEYKKGFTAIYKKFKLTKAIENEMDRLQALGTIDLIIVPFPMLQVISKSYFQIGTALFCTASIDRATGICSSTEFCFL